MNTRSYKTQSAKPSKVERAWFVVDAEGEIVGRLATKIAHVLRGKHKPSYTPHIDTGDHVIVVNAGKLRFTGTKMAKKEYQRYSGYPGGQRSFTPRQVIEKKPYFIIENAVRGMLPKNRLGRAMFRKLHVYEGTEHPHVAQKPEILQ